MKSNWKSKILHAGMCCLAAGMAFVFVSCDAGKRKQQTAQKHDNDVAPGDDLAYLLQPVNQAVLADIRTVTPLRKQMKVSTRASGTITYDTRRTHVVPVRFAGRIEQLYIDHNFQPVRKGQKILEIYSPEMVTAQNELLYLLKSDPENRQLINASRRKLRLLGLTDTRINNLIRTGEAFYSLAVYSPYNGYIYEGSAAAPALEASEPQAAAAMPAQTPLSIREGMYLSKGQTAFKVINTDRVRAEFNIYPESAPHIKQGDEVIIVPDFNQDISLKANVDFLQPFFQNGENFSKVRVYLDNSEGRLKPGELVTAQFQSQHDSAWWIPLTAVLDLGTKSVVFAKEGSVFRPRKVTTGRRSGDWTVVSSGLSAADTIASDGHYMVDSEGFVKILEDK